MSGIGGGESFWMRRALLRGGWARDVNLRVGANGVIEAIRVGVPPEASDRRLDIVVPGLGNVHSHAFQRGMAGLAEARSAGKQAADSFWSWREVMYRFLDRLDPEGLQAIAEQAYMEMLEAGFTRVGEFHYLHHAAGGKSYADKAEMCGRIAAAAQATGIGLTLLPVFYAHADFGGLPPTPGQARFVHGVDDFAGLLESAEKTIAPLGDGVLGIAPHSLRAVTLDELNALLPLNRGPVHIHIAEQEKEVASCLAWSGRRPVQWLYDNIPVDERWCLVHATHVLPDELAAIAASDAVVGLCPITEANLGDGLFPVRDFLVKSGRIGIGSDSNVLIDAAEELRLLEYGQRLQSRTRNVLADGDGASTGQGLFDRALAGGGQALGVPSGLQVGNGADFVELDGTHPALIMREDGQLLDGWIFATRHSAVRSVWRKGAVVVVDGRHVGREKITDGFRAAMQQLLSAE